MFESYNPMKNESTWGAIAVLAAIAVTAVGLLYVVGKIDKATVSSYKLVELPIVTPVCGFLVSKDIVLVKETPEYFRDSEGITYHKPGCRYGTTGKSMPTWVHDNG